jgi:hypothetical protein
VHPAETRMAYTVSMSADDARNKLLSGGIFLLLGAPDGLVFGIDQTVRCSYFALFYQNGKGARLPSASMPVCSKKKPK